MALQVGFQFHKHNPLPICSKTRSTRSITKIHNPMKHTMLSILNMMIFTHKHNPTIQISVMARPRHVVTASLNSHEDQPLQLHHRNSWTYYFLNYVPEDAAEQAQRQQQINELKEEVKKKFFETIAHKPKLEQLEFLDDIQRLGLGYHFEDEIEKSLYQIHEHSCHGNNREDLEDLYHASLRFRLLRQHGFHVPCDIFKQFLDENGKFKASLCIDVKGMLNLYEASHLRIRGEDILDQALTFTTAQLKFMKGSTTSADENALMAKVAHALKQPLHKGVTRLEARHYISLYEQDPSHNKMLLKFAKLDYNFLQSVHKKELADLSRWWRYDVDVIRRIPFKVRRDVLVETYFCGLGLMDERPQYVLGRMIYVKLILIGTVIDDLYDICDIADLELMTNALQRFNRQCLNQLPNHFKLVYSKLLDTFEEVEQHLAKEGRSHTFHYIIDSFKIMWIYHLPFSKWQREEYIPTFEDYMATTIQTGGVQFCTTIGYHGLSPEIATQEVFEWAMQFPKVLEAICTICRIEDDIAEDDLMENVATHKSASAISCYMKQYKVTDKGRAYEELRKMLDDPWKDINEAMLRPTIMPMPVLERILTQARCYHVILTDGDGFTCSDQTPMKQNLPLLFKDLIPV